MATTTWDQALLCVYLPDVHAEDNYNANNADLQKKLTTMTLVRRYIAPWWHITILKLQALPSWLLETPMPVRGVIVGGWGSLGWKERGREGVMCKAWLGLKAPKIHPKSENWTNQCVTKKEKFISPHMSCCHTRDCVERLHKYFLAKDVYPVCEVLYYVDVFGFSVADKQATKLRLI